MSAAPTYPDPQPLVREPKMDLAFFGILLYIFVEYTRLAAVFPVLQPFQVGKIAVALSAIGYLFGRKRWLSAPGRHRIDLSVAAFLAAVTLAAMTAQHSSDVTWETLIDAYRLGITYFLISRVVNSQWRLRVFLIALVLLNLKLAQFGIRTYVAGKAFGRSDEFMARGVGAGSTGFFSNSNDFGLAMCVIWPLAGFVLWQEKKTVWRVILLCAWLVIGAAIFISSSRGAMLATATVLIALWLRKPKNILALVLLLFVGGVAYLLLPEAIKERVSSARNYEQDQNAQIRLRLWKGGLRMFADHFLFGVGPGNFGYHYQRSYAPPEDSDPRKWAPHSIYIHAAAEGGLPQLICLLSLLAVLVRANNAAMRALQKENASARTNLIPLGLNLSILAFMVSGGFLTVLYFPHLWIFAGITGAVNYVATGKQLQRDPLVEAGHV
jgi:putative inorganic carbon (hco3(-)) transporter